MTAVQIVEYIVRHGKAAIAAGDRAAFQSVVKYAMQRAKLLDAKTNDANAEIMKLKADLEMTELKKELAEATEANAAETPKPKRRRRRKKVKEVEKPAITTLSNEPKPSEFPAFDHAIPDGGIPDFLDTPITDFGATSEVKDLEGESDDQD